MLKKLLASASLLLLIGAGCAAQPAPAPAPQPEPSPAEETSPQPTPTSGAPTTSAMPVLDAGTPPVVEMEVVADLSAAVSITAGGTFSPATLTVKQGTTVTWTNEGNLPVWPASAPHPVHTGYAGFDAKTDLRNGESYSFTFDKKGSWDYHNHMNPTVKGTVIVE